MLSLGTHIPNFYVLREDTYESNNYFYINIGSVATHLAEIMRWECETEKFIESSAIDDFIFICFMVGNDFLPHIPSIEIMGGGIDTMLSVYKQTGEKYGHLTRNINKNILFHKPSLGKFFEAISQYEKSMLEDKLNGNEIFFPDEILNRHTTVDLNEGITIDIEEYRNDYYRSHFQVSTKQVCVDYLEGMQWVLSYYTRGVPSWKWCYPYNYAPFAHELARNIEYFKFPVYGNTYPISPFQQLLSVLPPKSADLIPKPLDTLLTDPNSPLMKYCPQTIDVDLAGKRKDWEGIVILPHVNFDDIKTVCQEHIHKVSPVDLKRNVFGKSFIYRYDPKITTDFSSYYGSIPSCKVKVELFEL
jgi:5'-3' exonuclease